MRDSGAGVGAAGVTGGTRVTRSTITGRAGVTSRAGVTVFADGHIGVLVVAVDVVVVPVGIGVVVIVTFTVGVHAVVPRLVRTRIDRVIGVVAVHVVVVPVVVGIEVVGVVTVRVDAVVPDILGPGVDIAARVVAVVSTVDFGHVAIVVGVVGIGIVAVDILAPVGILGRSRVDIAARVVAVVSTVGLTVVAVAICVVVGVTFAVLIDTVVPRLVRTRVHRAVGVVAVAAVVVLGVEAVAVCIVVRGAITVRVDVVVPDLGGVGVDVRVRIIAVASTVPVGVFSVTVGVVVAVASAVRVHTVVPSVVGAEVDVGVEVVAVGPGRVVVTSLPVAVRVVVIGLVAVAVDAVVPDFGGARVDVVVRVVTVGGIVGVAVGHLARIVGHVGIAVAITVRVRVEGDRIDRVVFIHRVVTVVVDVVAVLGSRRADLVRGVVAVVIVLHVAVGNVAGVTGAVRVTPAITVGVGVVGVLDTVVDVTITVLIDAVADLGRTREDAGIEIVAVAGLDGPLTVARGSVTAHGATELVTVGEAVKIAVDVPLGHVDGVVVDLTVTVVVDLVTDFVGIGVDIVVRVVAVGTVVGVAVGSITGVVDIVGIAEAITVVVGIPVELAGGTSFVHIVVAVVVETIADLFGAWEDGIISIIAVELDHVGRLDRPFGLLAGDRDAVAGIAVRITILVPGRGIDGVVVDLVVAVVVDSVADFVGAGVDGGIGIVAVHGIRVLVPVQVHDVFPAVLGATIRPVGRAFAGTTVRRAVVGTRRTSVARGAADVFADIVAVVVFAVFLGSLTEDEPVTAGESEDESKDQVSNAHETSWSARCTLLIRPGKEVCGCCEREPVLAGESRSFDQPLPGLMFLDIRPRKVDGSRLTVYCIRRTLESKYLSTVYCELSTQKDRLFKHNTRIASRGYGMD